MFEKEQISKNSNNNGVTESLNSLDVRAPRRKGVRWAAAGLAATTMAGLGANLLDHDNNISASGEVKPGSSTKATISDWEMTSDILAARGDFTTESTAVIKVNMQYNTPADRLPVIGGVSKKIGDISMPDYEQKEEVTCVGELQEIIPSQAVSRKIDGDKLALTIDMSKIEINSYCNFVDVDTDPSTKKSLNEAWTVARDSVSWAGKKAGIMSDDTLPKPDVIMADVSDNAKSALTVESQQSMLETCGPKLNDLVEESAINGLKQNVLNLTDIKEKDLTVEASYENGDVNWEMPEDKSVEEVKAKSISAEPKINSFNFDKASCDTTKMKIVGEGVS